MLHWIAHQPTDLCIIPVFLCVGNRGDRRLVYRQDGEVIDWQAVEEKRHWLHFFSIDGGARHVSEIALADNDTIERPIPREIDSSAFCQGNHRNDISVDSPWTPLPNHSNDDE
jgi:aminopeptidase